MCSLALSCECVWPRATKLADRPTVCVVFLPTVLSWQFFLVIGMREEVAATRLQAHARGISSIL